LAELIYWYGGINAFALTPAQQAGLYANLPRVKAQQRIFDGRWEGLDYQGVYDLYLRAFEDTRLADSARTKFLEQYVQQQCGGAQ
jgi:hypothetical protein